MDFATTLKFAHVLAAVLWVGGGFTTIIAGIVLAGRSTAQTQLAIVQAVVLLAPRLFIPASIFTLASGVTLLFAAGWGWQPFTVLGLAGVVFTAGFGALRRVQRLAMMDYAIQFAIVFLMVVKPSWSDFAVFGGIGSIILLAALVALRPIPRLSI